MISVKFIQDTQYPKISINLAIHPNSNIKLHQGERQLAAIIMMMIMIMTKQLCVICLSSSNAGNTSIRPNDTLKLLTKLQHLSKLLTQKIQ